jgi:hypothetical protein
MKKSRRCRPLLTLMGLSFSLVGIMSTAAPAHANPPATTVTSPSATSASKIVVKVGDPIIIKDKKPAPKKK